MPTRDVSLYPRFIVRNLELARSATPRTKTSSNDDDVFHPHVPGWCTRRRSRPLRRSRRRSGVAAFGTNALSASLSALHSYPRGICRASAPSGSSIGRRRLRDEEGGPTASVFSPSVRRKRVSTTTRASAENRLERFARECYRARPSRRRRSGRGTAAASRTEAQAQEEERAQDPPNECTRRCRPRSPRLNAMVQHGADLHSGASLGGSRKNRTAAAPRTHPLFADAAGRRDGSFMRRRGRARPTQQPDEGWYGTSGVCCRRWASCRRAGEWRVQENSRGVSVARIFTPRSVSARKLTALLPFGEVGLRRLAKSAR